MFGLEVRHIFRTERPTNFKCGVQIEDEDPYRRDGASPAMSKVKVAMSRGASDRRWPISLERKVPEISKLVSRLRMPRTIIRTSFKVKSSKVKLDYCWSTKTYHIYRTGRLRNSQNWYADRACAQLPRPAIKAYKVGFLHAGGGMPCRPQLAATQLVWVTSNYNKLLLKLATK